MKTVELTLYSLAELSPPAKEKARKDAQEARQLAEYTGQREGEFAKGVSTYKNEWERAKPLMDAVTPHMPMFQQYGIDPAQQFTKYVEIHKALALGTPEQKLQTFMRMENDYNIPVQNLFARGQDGQIYYSPQVQQAQAAPQPQVDVASLVETKFSQYLAQQQARDFMSAKDATGNTAHPHFDVVRETMSQLLEAGLAEDIPSAYEAAIRHPRHSDLFDQLQQQKQEQNEAERKRKAAEDAQRARRNTISPRTATPASAVTTTGKKGLRATLEDAYDEHASGRV